MADIPGPLRLRRENQRFFLSSTEVRGTQSVQMSYAVPATPLQHIGQTGVYPEIANGAYVGSFSTSALFVNNDPYISYTGDFLANGYLHEVEEGKATSVDTLDIGFTSGVLSNYTFNCAVGQIPRIDAQFSVFGNMGPLTSSNAESTTFSSEIASQTTTTSAADNGKDFTLQIADPRSLTLSMDDFETNRLNSFSITIGVPRRPVYGLGEKTPIKICRNFPIPVQCTFQIDMDAHNMKSKTGYDHKILRDFPCSPHTENLTLQLFDHNTDGLLQTYSFTDLLLVSQSQGTNIDGNVTSTLSYRALIDKKKL